MVTINAIHFRTNYDYHKFTNSKSKFREVYYNIIFINIYLIIK